MISLRSKRKKAESQEFPKKENRSRLLEILEVLAKHEIVKGITPEKLRAILEDIGPTFVKIGQIMSMRQDILPAEYCNELVKLRTDVRPIPLQDVYDVISEEYGASHKDVFSAFDPVPLGSASIAQVHAATLKNGKRVVVKVQRKGIKSVMARDIALLRKAASLIKFAGGTGDTIDFNRVLDEMWAVTQQEMDFLIEASNADKFAELNKEIVYASCPEIEHKYTTSRVLVMEYIEGVQIDDLEKLRDRGYDLDEIGSKLAENYVKQVIEDSFFQADPHPGNIRIRDGQIVWIDLGMMGQLTTQDRLFLRSGVKAIAERDIFELQSVILSMGDYKGKINHARLYTDVDDMLTKYATRNLNELDLSLILDDFFTIAKSHGITLPKGVTMLARGIMTIEGVLTTVSPQINFMQIMVNHMKTQKVKEFDLEKQLLNAGNQLYYSGKKVIDIPPQISDLLKMAIKGQAKFNLELIGSEEPLRELDKMVNKVILCITDSAILMASSLICTTNMTPKAMGIPLLGFFGYLTALILSIILIWDILKKKWR